MTTIVVLQGTTTWSVPSDWNNANNTISTIGGGGSGSAIVGGASSGGGGGAFAASTNATVTNIGTGSQNCVVGAGGAGKNDDRGHT